MKKYRYFIVDKCTAFSVHQLYGMPLQMHSDAHQMPGTFFVPFLRAEGRGVSDLRGERHCR